MSSLYLCSSFVKEFALLELTSAALTRKKHILAEMDENEQNRSSYVSEENEVSPGNDGESLQQRNEKEISENLEETNQESKGIQKCHEDNLRHEAEEVSPGKEKKTLHQSSKSYVEKREEELRERKTKKSIPKQNQKGRHTIPQPFAFATEKRIYRERSTSELTNPRLPRSTSWRADSKSPIRNIRTQTSLRLERITELRHERVKSGSSQSIICSETSLKIERSIELRRGYLKPVPRDNQYSEKQNESKNQMKGRCQKKEVDIKISQSKSKHYTENSDTSKSRKSSTFKASPLPSFYHKRSFSPKPKTIEKEDETKIKMQKSSSLKTSSSLPSFYHKRAVSLKPEPVEKEEDLKINKMQKSPSFKASPLPSFYHKKVTSQNSQSMKIPLTQPKSPDIEHENKSTSDLGNGKIEVKNKAVSQTISNSAKKTLKKLLRGSWKAPNSKRKETQNSSASCGVGLEKEVTSSTAGNNVVVDV